jgi:hypothetical protein
MSSIRSIAYCMLPVSAALVVACSGGDKGASDSGGTTAAARVEPTGPRATIVFPAEGDTVPAGPLEVRMSVAEAKIVPAASATNPRVPQEGHLHLFLDRDVTRPDAPIPFDPTIVHLGNGATEHVFASLAPGPHRIIVVFAFSDHAPDISVASDTVNIIVK